MIYNKSNLWTQNKNLSFFKAGSFTILKKNIFSKVGGYESGLWKRIDTTFYNKVIPLKPKLIDMTIDYPEIINTSIALQHIDNIWGRKSKGLLRNKQKQLTNFFSSPIDIDISNTHPYLVEDYDRIKSRIIRKNKFRYPISYLMGI